MIENKSLFILIIIIKEYSIRVVININDFEINDLKNYNIDIIF